MTSQDIKACKKCAETKDNQAILAEASEYLGAFK